MNWLRKFGPGLLVTAAFIGPGTVTTATKAGASFGFVLMWAVVFSILAAIVLQEMAARLGLVAGVDLGEAIRTTFRRPVPRLLSCGLVIAAIGFGNAAYQMGNISGAALGLEAIAETESHQGWAALIAALAFALLATGVYKIIERVLIALVVLMSVVFVSTAVYARPDVAEMARGLFVPDIPNGSLLTIVALIGTTVVPYNLFLHSSSVREKWPAEVPREMALRDARLDTCAAISLGGIVTLAIIATAAAAFFGTSAKFDNAAGMAAALEPLFGSSARYIFGIGLLSAGMTSAVTAPLAAAYATAGALGWPADMKSWRFRGVWATILIVGAVLAVVGRRPVEGIIFAQAANGVLLPLVAVFLLVVLNRRDLMGAHVNRMPANVAGVLIVLIAAILGGVNLLQAVGVL